jgi:hypothetical protein
MASLLAGSGLLGLCEREESRASARLSPNPSIEAGQLHLASEARVSVLQVLCHRRSPLWRRARRVEPLGFAFQKFSKPDRHRLRIRVNHVPTFQVADQNAIKIIQVVIKDDGNPRPFSIVAKNLSTSHDRDIFASILIGDEILCHVSLGPRSRQSKRRRR